MSAAIPPLAPVATAPLALQLAPVTAPPPPASSGFGALLLSGLHRLDAKLDAADALVRRFAIDDGVPIHQVTIALEEARLAVELAMQVRGRLVEGYRDLMNMQL